MEVKLKFVYDLIQDRTPAHKIIWYIQNYLLPSN